MAVTSSFHVAFFQFIIEWTFDLIFVNMTDAVFDVLHFYLHASSFNIVWYLTVLHPHTVDFITFLLKKTS